MTTKDYVRLGIASLSLIGLLSISKVLSEFRLIEFLEESEYYLKSSDVSFKIEAVLIGMLLLGLLLFVSMYYLVNMTDLSLKVKKWISIFACLAYIIVGIYGGISSYKRNSELGIRLEEDYKKMAEDHNKILENANNVSASEFEKPRKFRVAEPPFNRIILHSFLCSIILLVSIYSFFQHL